MFAKDGATLAHLKGQFLRREPERIYQAIVHGHPMPAAGLWCDRLVWDGEDLIQRAATAGDSRGKEARSEYRVLQRLHGASLIEVRLVTGKRNQIRLQAELRGHPLVGETMYADAARTSRIAFPRQALHAWRLAFEHPVTGNQVRLESPLPSDMAALLARLSARRHPPGRRSIRQEPE
jgi:23S rRNA pseudouridine1911/1915/1917 synthase